MPANDDAARLRREIESDGAALQAKRRHLENIEGSCQHDWTETRYDPIRHPSTPNTMPHDGSHVPYDEFPYRQGSPGWTEDRWTRQCRKCGKIQATRRTRDEVKKVPEF